VQRAETVIVGAGMAGLACARALQDRGHPFLLLEASDRIGGRVRTDTIDGFRLDHGFQVFLTAYPRCGEILDAAALQLERFDPGARIRLASGECVLSDPFRQPGGALATALAPVGSLFDKLRVARLRALVKRMEEAAVFRYQGQTTQAFLESFGFSQRMIEGFFRPFLAGIFLESDLTTSAALFLYVYRFFTLGEAALPATGMEAIPRQLAQRLPSQAIRLRCPVSAVESGRVTLDDGTRLEASTIVIATDGDAARSWFPELPERPWNATTTFYFAADQSPFGRERKIWLNGTGKGQINHIAVPTAVAPTYGQAGRQLISVNTVDRPGQTAQREPIEKELGTLFGDQVNRWEFLKAYSIRRALPAFSPHCRVHATPPRPLPGVVLCGDHTGLGSLEFAVQSGQVAAEAVLQNLSR
jgi:phytoene dehydrogenase-like protein